VRQAVFDATLALLAGRRNQAFTIESVAAAAGVNKTTIYRNWPTKTSLILAAAEDRSEAMITTRSTGDPEGDLVAFLTSVAKNVTSPLGRALVIATLTAEDDREVQKARDVFWRHRFAAARDLIRTAVDGGEPIDDAEADRLIERLVGPVYLRVFVTGAPVDAAFISDTVRAVLRT
jgi:AcrR family transcriptional regulator